ncbi:MAG: 50S ribosomal protein L5 [Cyanobacteria bacterium HKST-UBA04]|nr:50S ribosomal protein L5 [Cyanobacteria bacterium HKST-UBA04]MCA9841715.1 50S ribosomal protein L5 [Cyanobacteria bacterium HKST-UBA03]
MSKTLRETYRDELVAQLMKELDLKNVHQVPRLEKIVINVGLGEAIQNSKALEAGTNDLQLITGQKPLITRARKSVAGFKIRDGMAIGAKVTLRGDRMYDFMAKLVNIVMPRIRDFRGMNPNAFDGRGNYNIGLKDQLVFPEIDYDKIDRVRGMNITICTTADTDAKALAMLKAFGIPFKDNKKPEKETTSAA